MTFKELGANLQTFLTKKTAQTALYAENRAKAEQRFKGDFLTNRLAEEKADHDSKLYALQSGIKADIEAVRAEKIKLADAAATKAPSQDTMMLLQALSFRKSVSRNEVIALAEGIKENYPALAALRDIAADKGYTFDVVTPDQTKQRINKACDLALRAVDGELDALTLAALGDKEYKINQYNGAEQRRDVGLMMQIEANIKSGASLWDSTTAQLDAGYINTPEVTKALTPGEREIVKRMFDNIPADRLKEKVNDKAAESPEMRGLIELSDFASLLDPDNAA